MIPCFMCTWPLTASPPGWGSVLVRRLGDVGIELRAEDGRRPQIGAHFRVFPPLCDFALHNLFCLVQRVSLANPLADRAKIAVHWLKLPACFLIEKIEPLASRRRKLMTLLLLFLLLSCHTFGVTFP